MTGTVEHTPGPWHLLDIAGKEAHVFAADKYQVADCESYKRSNQECLANAKLIAAAPDMADVLRKILTNNKQRRETYVDFDSIRAALAQAGLA